MRRVCALLVVLAMTVSAGVASRAAGVPPQITIEPGRYDPAVLVVAPGTRVTWRNADGVPRGLAGGVVSPPVPPGATHERRFRRAGRYPYRDAANADITGTVLVVVGAGRRPRYGPPPGPRGRPVEHRWRARIDMALRENWTYVDGKFRSTVGPCNAEEGRGSRIVRFRATIADVRYTRAGAVEILGGRSGPHRIARYREAIDATSSDPGSGAVIGCPDGSFDVPPVVRQACDHDYGARRVRTSISWGPTVDAGRMLWRDELVGAAPGPEANCGVGYLGAGVVVGLEADRLPFSTVGAALLHDEGRTSPLTAAEARAIRTGRPVAIVRQLNLAFTTDCCTGWTAPGSPTTYVRVGTRMQVVGNVTIRLTPR